MAEELSQKELIGQLSKRKITVAVEGGELIVPIPPYAAAQKVRKLIGDEALDAMSGGKDLQKEKGTLLSISFKLAVASAAACFSIDNDQSYRLILSTGGEFGELSKAVQKQCGVDSYFIQALEEGALDPPT